MTKTERPEGRFIGEKRLARELGYYGSARFIWTACATCGKTRWMNPHSPKKICRSCGGRAVGKSTALRQGKDHPAYKTGRYVGSGGYCYVLIEKDDPLIAMAGMKRHVLEHRLIVARRLGRVIGIDEVVHHIDGDKLNNDPSNLQLLSRAEHTSLHRKQLRILRQQEQHT